MEKSEFKVTPWEVSGKIDYSKLVKQFDVSKIDDKLLNRIKKHTKDLHFMLRRNVFFAHRDFHWLLDQYEKGNKFSIYTGRGPSGKIQLGHLQTWYFTKWLQDKFGAELWFQFTDDEKFLFKDKSYEEIQKWTYDNMLDVIAIGFDPKKTHFLIDTKHASLIYPEAIKFAKKITFSTKRTGKFWLRVFPHKPVTSKPVGVKMGGGKGEIDRYVVVVKPGMVIYEIGGVTKEVAHSALRKAGHKLSVRTTVIEKV